MLYAISCARDYIYFEDQYMVSKEIAKALRVSAGNLRLKRLVARMNDSN